MELKARKDMNPEFMWDFTHIYPTKADWEADCGKAARLVDEAAAFAGRLGESKETFKAALDAYAAAHEVLEKAFIYAMLHKSGDNGDPEYQEMEGKCMRILVDASTKSAFLQPEILSLPEEQLASYMEWDEMAVYRHMVEDITRGKAHTLSQDKEEMLAMLSDAARTPDNAFSMLESVDITFPTVKDEEGNDVQLTHGNFGVFRESKVQSVRKEAFETYFGEFAKYNNTLCALYTGNVKFDNYYAKVRGYESACAASLFANNVPMSVYDSLVEAIHEGLPTMRKYLELRKKVLGLDELNLYDLYNPMMEEIGFPVNVDEAKAMVKAALRPLGERYQELLDEAYTNHWMDVYENKGKTTGAFSCGLYGVHPYVLLNFTDTLDDAFTMAHELGHAMHSYFSAEANPYINSDYALLVAEVASTVNEVFLTRYLLATETDKKRRAYILNHFLEGFRTTVFRQTLFAEFERKVHEMEQSGEPITAQTLNRVYHDLNALYYEGCVINECCDVEWSRIPHFYNAFYVYQYATGFCSAVAIADGVLSSGDASHYLKFLTTGGSDYPMEELKIAGVDLSTPATVRASLKVFDDAVEELSRLMEELA